MYRYSIALRHSLSDTTISVAELIPPSVKIGLAGAGLNHGAAIDEFCDSVFKGLFVANPTTMGIGSTANLVP